MTDSTDGSPPEEQPEVISRRTAIKRAVELGLTVTGAGMVLNACEAGGGVQQPSATPTAKPKKPPQQSPTPTPKPTPNNLIIDLFSSDDAHDDRISSYQASLNNIGDVVKVADPFTGTPYTISDKPIPLIINKIKSYVLEKRQADPNFTLDNLVFAGHGDRNLDLINGDQNILMLERGLAADGKTPILDEFPAVDFMDALVALQKELGGNPFKRVVLGECRTFARLQDFPNDTVPINYIEKYKNTAQTLNAEIVGYLTNVYTEALTKPTGYAVKFNPDGKSVSWDHLTNIENYPTFCKDLNDCDASVEANGAWTGLKFPPPTSQALIEPGQRQMAANLPAKKPGKIVIS